GHSVIEVWPNYTFLYGPARAKATCRRGTASRRSLGDRASVPPPSRTPPRPSRAAARDSARALSLLVRSHRARDCDRRRRRHGLARDRETVRPVITLEKRLPRVRTAPRSPAPRTRPRTSGTVAAPSRR